MANQWGKWGGTVDTLANLSAIVTANEDDGQLRPVMENESTYVLHKNSAEAVSGDNKIVAADVAENKWHRYGSSDQNAVVVGTEPPPNPSDELEVYYHVIAGPPARVVTYIYEATIPHARHSSPIVYDFSSANPDEAIPTGDFEGQEVISIGNRTVFKWFNDGVELKWHEMYTFIQ